jgi:GxxExxY protein
VAGIYRADFVVSQNVIVELKAIKRLSEIEEAQLLNYLKATNLRVGLLVNFGGPRLDYRRRIS